jgi:hypothetical protein
MAAPAKAGEDSSATAASARTRPWASTKGTLSAVKGEGKANILAKASSMGVNFK